MKLALFGLAVLNSVVALIFVMAALTEPDFAMLPVRAAPEPVTARVILFAVLYILGNLFVAWRALWLEDRRP